MKNLQKQFWAIICISVLALVQPMKANLSKDDKLDLGLIAAAGLAAVCVVDAAIKYERNKAAERSLERASLEFRKWYLKNISGARSLRR